MVCNLRKEYSRYKNCAETKVDEKGNVVHVYEKVKTTQG